MERKAAGSGCGPWPLSPTAAQWALPPTQSTVLYPPPTRQVHTVEDLVELARWRVEDKIRSNLDLSEKNPREEQEKREKKKAVQHRERRLAAALTSMQMAAVIKQDSRALCLFVVHPSLAKRAQAKRTEVHASLWVCSESYGSFRLVLPRLSFLSLLLSTSLFVSCSAEARTFSSSGISSS